MSLHTSDWEVINSGVTRLYRELDSEKHSHLMLEVLHELVPADSLALQSANPQTPMHLSAKTFPVNHATPEQIQTIARYSHQSPFAAYYLSTWDGSWKMITDFMEVEEFRQTDLHRLALSPLGIQHQIFSVLGIFEHTGYAIVINRNDREFSERDRDVLNTIHPHLVTSFFNAQSFGRAKESISYMRAAMETAPGAYAYFDKGGRLVWMQDRTEAWLQDFFRDEARNEDNVPHSIQRLLNHLVHGQSTTETLESEVNTERLIVCLGSSAAGGWIMRLERKPKAPRSHFRPLPQLSERKNEVLKWMVEGKRNGEIATILNLSSRTVENHVRDILKELMVENRATAIVRAIEYSAAVNTGMTAPPAGTTEH